MTEIEMFLKSLGTASYAQTPNELGIRAKAKREEMGLRVTDLARISGVCFNTVSRFERGVGRPTPERLAAILEALGMEGEWAD